MSSPERSIRSGGDGRTWQNRPVPIFRLGRAIVFPPPELADPEGILAVGGDLRPERLLAGYRQGIFPWYHDGLPILWHSPDPRFVLPVDALRIPRSLKKVLAKHPYELRLDTAFRAVIDACSKAPRPGQDGTWITAEMKAAYVKLHELGWAHSAEAWLGGKLVGGLYGVAIGRIFFGESMFAKAPDASKIAFVSLVRQLERWGFRLVDSQVHTEHVERFGAEEWPRKRYLDELGELVDGPSKTGKWEWDGEVERVERPASSVERES